MTIEEAARSLRDGRVSSVELTAAALAAIDRHNPALRAFITVTSDYALLRARQADEEMARGFDRGPLYGIPIAVKDLFHMRGVRTTHGSKIFENLIAGENSAVVERLEAAGAVIVGKTNMHELAYGITSANPHFGAVRNPWDVDRSPGGSSGGSGAAVAASLVYAAMGSDTGGSIRIPSSFCGTVGLKPTYGRVSRYGALPLGWSLDHMGPLARSVRDAALMLNAIAGYDRRDETSARNPVVDYVPQEGCTVRGLRIGVPDRFFFERLDADVESGVRGALAQAESLGARVIPVTAPDLAALNAIARVVLLCEASAAFGPYMSQRDRFGRDVLALLDQGRMIPAVDYIDAQRLRRGMLAEFEKLWTQVDCVICPATPMAAPLIGETAVRLGGEDEDVRLAATRLVRGINLLGYPALALPCGLTGRGLPVGLQIVGRPFEEAVILRLGAALEDADVGIPPCPLAGG